MSPAARPVVDAGRLAREGHGFPPLDDVAEAPREAVAAAFGTDLDAGLSAAEALARLRRVGPNDPAPESGPRWPGIALRQLSSKLLWLLIVAMLISMGLGEWLNAFAIGITVVIAAAFGFFTEYRSERAAAALRSLTAQRAEVVREGLHEEIPATEIVPGDLVALSEGRIVPADGRVVLSQGLLVNEAILTGESAAVAKTEELAEGEALRPPTAVYGGTTVVAGSGLAVIAATGAGSALGSMVTAMRTAERPPTPLEARLEALGKRLIAVFLGLCALLPIIGLIQGREARPMVELAVALAIGAVPEGLPAVATAALAIAVHRLAGRKVLVRRLEAVETLGSATIIATDKTGTLTLNRMVLRAVVLPGDEAVRVRVDDSADALQTSLAAESGHLAESVRAAAERVLVVAALCNDAVVEWDAEHGWHAHGDPSEAAIRMAAQGLGWGDERLDTTWPRVATEPFTTATRLMQTTHRPAEGPVLRAIKGAYEQVAARCTPAPADLHAAAVSFAESGYRVFAVAEAVDEERARLLGLIVLEDPVRDDAREAVAACRAAGIRLLLVTGDHARTARNVASETGLLEDNGVVVEGGDVGRVSLERVAVVARATHGEKEDLVRRLQQAGAVVAMTGDGVNDAPALRAADVGVAVGPSAADVAVEAADVLLSDGRLLALVEGIREGRAVTTRLRHAIVYLLTASFGVIVLMVLALGANRSEPLAPLQILWLNLVVHLFPALALSTGREPAPAEARPTTSLLPGALWLEVAVRALLAGVAGFVALLASDALGGSERHAQSLVFATVAAGLVGQAFLIGVDSWAGAGVRLRRAELWGAVGVSALLVVVAFVVPGLRRALHLEVPGLDDWAVVAACGASAFAVGQVLPRLILIAVGRWRPPTPAVRAG